jgi:putative zinc finger/helix-turn-helix YgiT family protein
MSDKTTNSGGSCSMCGHAPLESKLIDKTFEYGEDDESITVTARNVPVRACANCGEYFSGPAAASVEHEAICQALGLEPPSKIKAIREQFGWSQQYLADLAEIGIATLSRIERGRLVQSRSVNGILRDLRDCPAFREHRERLLGARAESKETVRDAVCGAGQDRQLGIAHQPQEGIEPLTARVV